MSAAAGGGIKGRYEKRQILGEGGMGVVFRAYDMDLKREVALKTLRDGGDELALEMFRKECGVLASLNHPNIVDIYDVGQFEEEGVEKPYFVMPLLPGITLDRVIKNEPQRLNAERTVEIIAQTCRGLQAAHERGLIHRDLKPSNIFVLGDDSVKIIDFGIAHLTGTHTSLGLKGTVYYMAPEQLEMKPASAQSDIYSLGVVCYEILGRRRPFAGASRDEVIRGILRAAPPPLHEINPLVSHAISQVIHAALAKKPYHRYQSAREFADCLQKALRNQPLERFNPERVEPRIQKVEKALAGQEYEFANEILSELEEEGQLHSSMRTLRNRLDESVRERSIAQLMESARRRLEDHEFQLALQKVQEVLQLDPRHTGALGLRADIESRRSTEQIDGWVRLARQHLDRQKFSLAREALNNALAINPHDTAASTLSAEIERSERAAAQTKARRQELYQQAQEAWQRGDVTAALSKIERVMEEGRATGGTPAPESELGATYQTFYNKVRSECDTIQNRYEEARQQLANGDFAAAGAVCDAVLAKYPNHALFQALKFDAAERHRQSLSADMARVDREVDAEPDLNRRVGILEEAAARHPGEDHFRQALAGMVSKRDLVNSIAAKAREFEESGHFHEAISQWDILRNIYPQFPGLEFERERLKKRREQQARMDAKARWAERIDAALSASDHGRAIELSASGLAEYPGDPELTTLDKLARQGQERSREGQEAVAKGLALRQAGKLDEAIAVLRDAIAQHPKHAAARTALVDALVERAGGQIESQWQSAGQSLDQALDLDPGHTQARSMKTLLGDKQREAAVSETLSRARERQASGDARGAYQEVLAGLASYPLDARLMQLKKQLGKSVEGSGAPPAGAAAVTEKPKQKPQPPAPAPLPPPVAKPAPAAKRSPMGLIAAALAVPLLGAGVWFALKAPTPPPPPPPDLSGGLVAFTMTVTPEAARLRAEGKDFGANRNLELPEGDREIEVYGDGIKPMRIPVKVAKGMPAPPPVEAQFEPPVLILALSGARVTLDGKLLTTQGQMAVEPGNHRLELFQGATGRGVLEFTVAPGAMPVVKTAAAQNILLTAVATFGGAAKVFGARKAGLGAAATPADVPATGLDLTGLTGEAQVLQVSDGTESRTYDLTRSDAPSLAVFVADPGRVDLAISSNEEGAVVAINGRPSGAIQKGQRLEQLAPGVYRVKVSKPGFADLPERTVTLAKGRAARESFELKPVLASLRITGVGANAQVLIDGRPMGELHPGEPFTLSLEPGRHRVSVRAEHHQTAEREVELRTGSETVLNWRELAVATGAVQLAAPPAGFSVSYSPTGGGPPKAAQPGSLTLPVGDYVFRAFGNGGPEQTQPVTVRMGQTTNVAFNQPRPGPVTTETPKPPATAPVPVSSLFDEKWKDSDDGWRKLDSGHQAVVIGGPASLTFQVQRKGRMFGLGGRPGWLYVAGGPGNFARFELSSDKLTWWVVSPGGRERKAGEVNVPKDVEDIRIDIAQDAMSHSIGGVATRMSATDLGINSLTGGQFRFRGPISVRGLSVRR